jgi:TRAP-type transport system small permease protein
MTKRGYILEKFKNILGYVITVLFVGLFFCAILQVLSRYILPYSIPWTEEFARFLIIYIVFIGAVIAIYEKTHISIIIFINKLHTREKLIVQTIMNLFILFFLYLVFRGGISTTIRGFGIVSGSMPKFMIGYVYIIIPISAFLMAIFLLKNIFDDIMTLKKLKSDNG